MQITKSIRYIQAPFDSEEELEQVVIDNYEYIFGLCAIYLPRGLVLTSDGFGAIPDDFAFYLSKEKWFFVESEIVKHNIWNHIAPQVEKQITTDSKPESKFDWDGYEENGIQRWYPVNVIHEMNSIIFFSFT